MVCLTNVLSDDSSSVDLESLSSLVGDGIVSSSNWSNGSSSSVKEPPLSDVPWLMVVDSKSVLTSTNVFMPEESSSVSHSCSDLESNFIVQWLSWPLLGSLVNPPGLVETVVAVVIDNPSLISVGFSVNIETFLCVVSDVSS